MKKTQGYVNSADSIAEFMRGATKDLVPPTHIPLGDRDWPFWENVVAEFARAHWTPHQLELAAMLARTMANLEEEQRALRGEGFVVTSQRGTPMANPRAAVVKALTGQILSLRRSLALHIRGKVGGDNRAAARAREVGLNAERAALTVVGEDGIARPH